MNLVYPRALAVCALTLTAATAFAQYRPRAAVAIAPSENYHVELGAGFWNPSADMQIADGAGGSTVDLKNDLGLQDRKVGEFQLVIKPAVKHKIRVQFIPLRYTQTGSPRTTLTFNGQTFPAGVPVSSSLRWNAWRFGYEYDFTSTPRGFLGVIVDLKYTDVLATLTPSTSPAGGASGTASAKAPIPALGAIGRLYLAENLSVTGELTGFAFPGGWIKSASGHYADMDLYAMLNFVDSFGIRAGYRKFDVEYDLTSDTGTFKLSGPYLGVSLRF